MKKGAAQNVTKGNTSTGGDSHPTNVSRSYSQAEMLLESKKKEIEEKRLLLAEKKKKMEEERAKEANQLSPQPQRASPQQPQQQSKTQSQVKTTDNNSGGQTWTLTVASPNLTLKVNKSNQSYFG